MRVLTVDGRRTVPVHEGADGPAAGLGRAARAARSGRVYLGEADGVPYAAVRGERALTVNGRPVDTWAGLREVGADLGDLDAGLLVAGHRHPRVARAQPVQPAVGRARRPSSGRLGAARPGDRRSRCSRAPTPP